MGDGPRGEGIGLIEQNGADVLLAEAKHQAGAAVGEIQQLVHGGGGQAADPGDTVAHRGDAAHFADAQTGLIVRQALVGVGQQGQGAAIIILHDGGRRRRSAILL